MQTLKKGTLTGAKMSRLMTQTESLRHSLCRAFCEKSFSLSLILSLHAFTRSHCPRLQLFPKH